MRSINLPWFYSLGTQLNPIIKLSGFDESKRIEIFTASWFLKPKVEFLLSSFPELAVCRATGTNLIKAIDAVVEWVARTKGSAEEINTPDSSANTIFYDVVEAARKFEVVLSEELQMLSIYCVTKKGIYNIADLIDRAEIALPPSFLKKMDAETINEIRQSGRCLAFDNFTASGFHILRATERVMHQYYLVICNPTKRNRLKSWALYIKELIKDTSDDNQKVVALLQQIKDNDRNLIMHPEIVLSNDESFRLFVLCKSIIMAMADRLPEVVNKTATQA